MSLFGEPLPFEDDTAATLIRRCGFPPEETYDQMPEIYQCPCCSEFSKNQERERLLQEARAVKDAEHRRLMQLDVFEERARPLPSAEPRRKIYRRVGEDDEPGEVAPSVPPPPPTIDDLRRAKRDYNVPKLVVTVHHGRNISAQPEDPISVIVRCGAFEGQTAKVRRGEETATPWEELFEFPYMNADEPLEVLVVNDALPATNDQLVGGVVIPSDALYDRTRGDQEPLPVMPEESMLKGYGTHQEGPLGAIVASWYVRNGDEKLDEVAMEQETLAAPLGCTLVAHHVFQYTDHGAEPYMAGVLCVLRDTDDNCSESVLYVPGQNPEPSLSRYYTKEGYHYLPENASQIMQLNTERKLGHILICVQRQADSVAEEEEEEELLVIGAVPLDFERLYNKGSAVLLIESKSREDAVWGEITIEWANKPLDEEDPHPASLEVQKESIFLTVVRGLNLVYRDGQPVANGYVSVAAGDLEGSTVNAAAAEDADRNQVINWNQEVRFIDVDRDQKEIEVQVFEKEQLISVGRCELGNKDEGVIIIQMHHAAHPTEEAGEIVVSYKRLHAPPSAEEIARMEKMSGEDVDEEVEEDEETEEIHQAASEHGEEEEEEEEDHSGALDGEAEDRAISIEDDAEEHGEEAREDEAAEEQEEEQEEERLHAEEEKAHHPEETGEEEPLHEEAVEEKLRHEVARKKHKKPSKETEKEDTKHRKKATKPKAKHHDETREKGRPDREEDEQSAAEEEPRRREEVESPHAESERSEERQHEDDEQKAAEEEPSRAEAEEETESHHEEREGSEEPSREELEREEDREREEAEREEDREREEAEREAEREREEAEREEDREREEAEREAEREREEAEREAEREREEAEREEDREREEAEREAEHQREEAEQEEKRRREEAMEEEKRRREEAMKEEERRRREAEEEEARRRQEEEEEEERRRREEEELFPEDAAIPTDTNEPGTTPTAAKKNRRRVSWSLQSPSKRGYQQPWYPSGAPETEQHIPFSKTKLSKVNIEGIRDLETRKIRLEEESVRRTSTPRRSGSRGVSPNSQ